MCLNTAHHPKTPSVYPSYRLSLYGHGTLVDPLDFSFDRPRSRQNSSLVSNVFVACSGGRGNKTFKPKKNIPEGTHQYDLMKHAAATLGSGNLRLAVMLPEGEDLNEWVAVNSKFSVNVKQRRPESPISLDECSESRVGKTSEIKTLVGIMT